MSEIEAEIRRQMLAERDRALQSQAPPQPGAAYSASPALDTGRFEPSPPPPPPAGSSYHALPPPSFPQTGATYPPYCPPASYPLPSPAPQMPSPALPSGASASPSSTKRKGVLGGLGAVGIVIAKSWGVIKGLLIGFKFLVYGKYLITAGTMLASIALYSTYLGWRFAAGIVLLLFIHEMGHVVAIKRLGQQVTAMVFVPFMGAYVQHKKLSSPAENAQIAIMGPAAGMLGGLAFGAAYGMTGSPLWLVLAYYSFLINLFNLSAIPFLDGGRITVIIPPKILLCGLLATVIVNFKFPICWLLLLFALPQITERWRSGTIDPALPISRRDQQTYTLAYFGLTLFLGFASLTTQQWLWNLRHLLRHH